jgi:hypothetical protein
MPEGAQKEDMAKMDALALGREEQAAKVIQLVCH